MALQERLSLRSLYLYLVCLVTLVISIFASVSVVRAAVGLAYPEPAYYAVPLVKEPGVSEEEQRRAVQAARDAQRRQGVLDLVGSGTLLLLAGPLYVYHWRRVQAERRPSAATPSTGGPPAG